MKYFFLTLFFSFNVAADISCYGGALVDTYHLFQEKTVCTAENLERIYNQFAKIDDECRPYKNYEAYIKAYKKSTTLTKFHKAYGIKGRMEHFTGLDHHRTRFEGNMMRIGDSLQFHNEGTKAEGKRYPADFKYFIHDDLEEFIADCKDAFVQKEQIQKELESKKSKNKKKK